MKIKKCKCGSDAVLLEGKYSTMYNVQCSDDYCDRSSGNYGSEEEAIEGWNNGDTHYYGE